jgi:ribonuclease Z
MDHGTPSAAYVVREAPRVNVDPARLAALGLRPGPWLQRVRGPRADYAETIEVGGQPRRVRELQESLVTVTDGDSVAYLSVAYLTVAYLVAYRDCLSAAD